MSFTPPPSLPPREEQATNRRVQILREGRPVSNIYDPDRNTSFPEQSDGSTEVSTSPLRRFLSEQPRHRSGGRGDNAGIEKVSLISRWMAEKRRESRDVGSLNKKKTSGFTPRKKVLEQQQQQRERRCVSYRWKIRIESILLLCILGIPGKEKMGEYT